MIGIVGGGVTLGGGVVGDDTGVGGGVTLRAGVVGDDTGVGGGVTLGARVVDDDTGGFQGSCPQRTHGPRVLRGEQNSDWHKLHLHCESGDD